MKKNKQAQFALLILDFLSEATISIAKYASNKWIIQILITKNIVFSLWKLF